ncbi:MAG TPA: GDYXXLXY domain-containing protein [Gammaproteobacteria bacterium]
MKRNIIIVALLQVLFLCGMVAAKQYTLETGEPVLLETQPIDPRSLFRGDYVRLDYAINNINLDAVAGDDAFERHDDVYVVLEKDGPYHRPVAVYNNEPAASGETVVIRGRVRAVSDRRWNPETRKMEQVPNVTVRYGIENYFVPEGTGRELELRWRDGEEKRVDIRVAVDRFGKAGIKAVLVNGEERYVETLF